MELSRPGLLARTIPVLRNLVSPATYRRSSALATFVLLMTTSRPGWTADELATRWAVTSAWTNNCLNGPDVPSNRRRSSFLRRTLVPTCLGLPRARSTVTATSLYLTSLPSLFIVSVSAVRLTMSLVLHPDRYVRVIVPTAAAPFALVGLTTSSIRWGPLNVHVVVCRRLGVSGQLFRVPTCLPYRLSYRPFLSGPHLTLAAPLRSVTTHRLVLSMLAAAHRLRLVLLNMSRFRCAVTSRLLNVLLGSPHWLGASPMYRLSVPLVTSPVMTICRAGLTCILCRRCLVLVCMPACPYMARVPIAPWTVVCVRWLRHLLLFLVSWARLVSRLSRSCVTLLLSLVLIRTTSAPREPMLPSTRLTRTLGVILLSPWN